MDAGFVGGYITRGKMEARSRMQSRAADAMVETKGLRRNQDLEDRVDRAALVIEAMWSLLEDSGYSRLDLTERILQVDGADGAVDGKATPKREPCSTCGAAVSASSTICQFCGAENPGYHPIQSI